MKSLDDLLALQGELEQTYADFLGSLEPTTTVTLRQLITEPTTSLDRLKAPWLNHDLLVRRFTALGTFFARLGDHPRLRNGCRLIFFQAASSEEDAKAHERLMDDFFYSELVGHLSGSAFSRLHTRTKWMGLVGTWEEGNRRIWPLSNYTTWYASDVLRDGAQTVEEDERCRKAAFGYAVVDWPTELEVGNDVATDYLVRQVIHDIGHCRLPVLNPEIDSLHNAVMLYAMGAETPVYENVWETMVHRECTDPYFYVYGENLLNQCAGLALTPLQDYYLKALRRWYQGPVHERNKEWLWGIERESSEQDAIRQMKAIIEEMCADGFLRYNLKT